MNWTFYIDALEIEEPVGFADLTLRAKRDDNWHGVFFEATTSDLRFYGAAFDYLKTKKEQLGLQADVTFRAVTDCGGEDEVFSGKLDFRKYQESCGNECLITLPVEQEGCIMTLRNRYDQKVDVDNRLAFDNTTILPDYNALNFEMELAAQETRAGIEGYVQDEDPVEANFGSLSADPTRVGIRPSYNREINNSINEGNLISANNVYTDALGSFLPPLTPQLLLDDEILCFQEDFSYEAIFKGELTLAASLDDSEITEIKARIVSWNAVGDFFDDSVLIAEVTIDTTVALPSGVPVTIPFNETLSGLTPIASEQGVYAYIEVTIEPGIAAIDITGAFDPETYININANRSCPPTDATVSMVHELASHITEAITDMCLKVKSDYYGRTDSEPYAPTEDGCGSLRVLTSGLKLRRAENPKHFMSLKELFDGLNGIDNIGMGVEDEWLRIEPVEYFYQDVEIMRMPFIPKASLAIQESMAYSKILVGYKKWETENVNGLDEFNSNKEFRTTLSSVNNTLDITSGLIAGGYPIEHTRQQSFADTGQADTKYDNDTFIICVSRQLYAYGNDYAVEQGITENAANFYSPATAYNWRIRPMYNLMRWWKSIAQSYVNLVNSASRLIFSAGTGNLEATGNLSAYDSCRVEATLKAENANVANTDIFAGAVPIWKPETKNFVYPMSLKDYNLIKANPLGYLSIQCGTGEYEKGFITNLLYRIGKGEVDVTVKLKWPTS